MLLLNFTFMLFIASCSAVFCEYETFTSVALAFSTYFLVPTVINVPPPKELSVRFSSEVVNLGNKIPAYSASIPPYIHFHAEPGELYTIAVLDADFPSAAAPIDAQKVHALIVNSPGNDLVEADYLTSYIPAIPYPGSGYHRYVILLFKQSCQIDIELPELQNLPSNLTDFSIKDFARRFGLGDCIAGNFFLSQTIVCDQDEDISRTCTP